jgi:hypothetical protein
MSGVRQLSKGAQLNVAGLILTAVGMLLQIASGSALYPSFTGPIVLLVAAAIVAFVRGRWTAWVGLLVPLFLGVGAILAALMTGAFVAQLTDVSRAGILIGSLMHVVGLVGAIIGGSTIVLRPARTIQ